jgi:chromate transporter
VPASIGLVAASAYVVAEVAVHNLVAAAVTLVTAAVCYATRLNPLSIFATAGPAQAD